MRREEYKVETKIDICLFLLVRKTFIKMVGIQFLWTLILTFLELDLQEWQVGFQFSQLSLIHSTKKRTLLILFHSKCKLFDGLEIFIFVCSILATSRDLDLEFNCMLVRMWIVQVVTSIRSHPRCPVSTLGIGSRAQSHVLG